MEEIWALQAEFERAQDAEIVQRLSERNCVEIVLKLIESGRIKLIFSSTGKDFLTPGRLKGEMLAEIRSHGGRISLTDLPDLLNIDLVNIERAASEIASSSSVLLVNGQLISKAYIDAICSEIAESVLESGMITLSALSQQFALPVGLIQTELEVRLQSLGDKLNCQLYLQNQRLFTDLYSTTHKAKIQGLLLGSTRPISLQSLISQYGLQEKLVKSLIHEMEGELPGTISGGSNSLGVFTPWVYVRAQKTYISTLYKQNSYVDISTVHSTGLAKPLHYFSELFSDAIQLQRIFINPVLLQSVESGITDIISSHMWLDARTVLPSSLSADDVVCIIKKAEESPLLKKASRQYHNLQKVFLVSSEFMKSCASSLDPIVVQLGTQAAHIMHQKGNQPIPVGDDSDSKGSKSKKDRSKKRSNTDSLSRHIRPLLDQDSLETSLKSSFPDCDVPLIEAIVSHLAPSLRTQFEKIRDSPHIINDGTEAGVDVSELRRKRIKYWIQHIQSLSENFQTFSAANSELQNFVDDISQLDQYLIRTFGIELSDALLHLSVYLNNRDFADEDKTALDDDRRSTLLAMLPAADSHSILSLSSSKTSSEFFSQFQSLAEKCDVKIKDVPKKKLKQNGFTMKTRLAQQVSREQRPEAIVLSAIILLLYRIIGMILHAPFSSVDCLLGALENSKISKEVLDPVKSLKEEIDNPSGDKMTSCIENVRAIITSESK